MFYEMDEILSDKNFTERILKILGSDAFVCSYMHQKTLLRTMDSAIRQLLRRFYFFSKSAICTHGEALSFFPRFYASSCLLSIFRILSLHQKYSRVGRLIFSAIKSLEMFR